MKIQRMGKRNGCEITMKPKFFSLPYKGAPAWESCTGTWLVSPVASPEKKKDTSRTGPPNMKLSILGHIIVCTEDPCSSTAQR